MNIYKSRRIIGWVVVDETGRILNRNPTKDELKSIEKFPDKVGKGSRRKAYNKSNTCDICGKDIHEKALREYKNKKDTGRWICTVCYRKIHMYGTSDNDKIQQIRDEHIKKKYEIYNETNTCPRIKSNGKICGEKLAPTKACREIDKNGKKTGRWICKSCYLEDDRKERYLSLSGCRTGNLDETCSTAIGNLFEELTEIWKNINNLNKELDCYNTPLDHSANSEGIIYQTKARLYSPKYRRWVLSPLRKEWKKEFHYMIFYCASDDGKTIERIYEIPKSEIIKKTGINILKYDLKGNLYNNGLYENYRITEDEIKKVNEIWKKIIKDRKIKKTI